MGRVELKIKEGFHLAVQAERKRVEDQRRSKAAIDTRPDVGENLANLPAKAERRMAECRDNLLFGHLPNTDSLLNKKPVNNLRQRLPLNLPAVGDRFQGCCFKSASFQNAIQERDNTLQSLIV